MSAEFRKSFDFPRVVTRTMVEAELDGTDAQRVPGFLDELAAVTADSIGKRLRTVYPAADELVEIIVTPEADAVEGACVIRSLAQVQQCR